MGDVVSDYSREFHPEYHSIFLRLPSSSHMPFTITSYTEQRWKGKRSIFSFHVDFFFLVPNIQCIHYSSVMEDLNGRICVNHIKSSIAKRLLQSHLSTKCNLEMNWLVSVLSYVKNHCPDSPMPRGRILSDHSASFSSPEMLVTLLRNKVGELIYIKILCCSGAEI